MRKGEKFEFLARNVKKPLNEISPTLKFIRNMAASSPPPTRQLFVRFPGHRPRDAHEVGHIFERFGQVKRVHLVSSRTAFVTFYQTKDAYAARRELHNSTVHDVRLVIEFNRPSRLLVIDDYPASFSRDEVANLVRAELSSFGTIEWIDPVQHKQTCLVYVRLADLMDATRIVQECQGRVVSNSNWKWEIEFHKVSQDQVCFLTLLCSGGLSSTKLLCLELKAWPRSPDFSSTFFHDAGQRSTTRTTNRNSAALSKTDFTKSSFSVTCSSFITQRRANQRSFSQKESISFPFSKKKKSFSVTLTRDFQA